MRVMCLMRLMMCYSGPVAHLVEHCIRTAGVVGSNPIGSTHMENPQTSGGIENTLVYWLAEEVSRLNHIFITRYIPRTSRTFDQMDQANRSGKQNLVEGSLENSIESNLKLTGVSRASYGELIEDYKDVLFKKGLPVWDKNDTRVLRLRKILIDPHETHVTHDAHESHGISFDDPEGFANLMITLCIKQGFLLDRFLAGIKNRFVREGGFRENLFLARRKALHGSHGNFGGPGGNRTPYFSMPWKCVTGIPQAQKNTSCVS